MMEWRDKLFAVDQLVVTSLCITNNMSYTYSPFGQRLPMDEAKLPLGNICSSFIPLVRKRQLIEGM